MPNREDFEGNPLYIGHTRGFRHWRIDDQGNLRSVVSEEAPWQPGENVAVCNASLASQRVSGDTPKGPHKPSNECSCGYYAYFNIDSSEYAKSSDCVGIIDGYGTCTVGGKGFRAEKARIVALVLPKYRRWPIIAAKTLAKHPRPYLWSMFALLVAALTMSLFAIFALPTPFLALWGLVALLGAIFLGYFFLTDPNEQPASWTIPVRSDLVRKKYPDVPVFKNIQDAEKAFPVAPFKPQDAEVPNE